MLGFFSLIFVADTKIVFGYNFVAPSKVIISLFWGNALLNSCVFCKILKGWKVWMNS